MSQRRHVQRPRAGRGQSAPPLSRLGRAQIAFVIVSSLVICAMLAAAVFTISASDLFSGTEKEEENAANYQDPNEDVIAEQQTVVASAPDDLEATLLLANLLGNSGRLAEAIPVYERAVTLAPEDAGVRLGFARALADGGMQADAELQFARTLELNPGSQPAHFYLAELYLGWSPPRTDEAIVHYREAAALDPSTLIGERASTQLASLGAATPGASPQSATPTT